MKFRGSYIPLITPFDRKGRVDYRALERNVDWLIREGVDGVLCSATTGEGPCLSDSERRQIAKRCIEASQKRVPVIVATGINDTRTSVRYTEIAQKLGADGCLVVTPYYNKPNQRGCILHFTEVAKVGLPVILYHNPPRAVVRLTAETILELSQVPHIVAIKESSHDLELIRKIAPHIAVFCGDDDLALETLKLGGVGTIVPTSHLVPRGWKKMVSLCLEKRFAEAEVLARRYLPLSRAIYLETNPIGPKFALSWLGRAKLIYRLPMVPPTEATQTEIQRALIRLALPQFASVSQPA